MKIPSSISRRREHGYVLLMTVGFALLLGITMGSYLLLSSHEDKLVVRAQRWNSSLALAEAGVDEALAQMNAWPSNFYAGDWGGGNPNYGPVTRTLADGSYTVIISNDPLHTVFSTGSVPVPDTDQKVSRTVKITAINQPLFNVGLGAVYNMNLNGNPMYTDSYNSTNGPYGIGPTNANGDLASVYGLVNIGNTTINGNVYLGPNATFQQGAVGTVSGSVYYDFNVQFPDAVLPTYDANGNTISWTAATTVNGTNVFGTGTSTNFTYLNGYYIINSSLNNSKPIYVAPGQTVTLQLTSGDFDPSSVTVDGGLNNSGTLIIYQDAGTVTLGGNASGGSIASRPINFQYYGLPGVTQITLGGTANFVGSIYAPEALLYLQGGGSSENIIGSVIVYQVYDKGHWNVHYDESLAQYGPTRGYVPTSWQELSKN